MSSQNADCSITTDEDDDSDQKSGSSYKERRREAHTQAEQKRRDAIKKGYEDLQLLVPTCTQQDSVSSYKLSKAAILQRSIEYIQTLQQHKHKREKELQLLRKEVKGLEIMKHNYEEMVKHHQQSQQQQQNFLNYNAQMISDETKFEVFKAICDSLFHSFDSSVQVGNFNELSACTIVWLEEHCKPHNFKQMTMEIMEQLRNQLKWYNSFYFYLHLLFFI